MSPPSPPLPLLPSGPVNSMDEGIARMEAISAALPIRDGLACFNRMYLIVTETVRGQVAAGFFADPDYMSALDVEFLNLYLSAIDGYQAVPPTECHCWEVLFAQRSDPRVTPMQFAVAGMSAHINHDLPLAVLRTSEALASPPDQGSHAADFDKVNQTLGALDQQIRESFETGIILDLDHQAAGLLDVIGNFSIDAARQAAWEDALALWDLRADHLRFDLYVDGLDRAAELAGRALLVPCL
jgi:Family of unknown function (DUF5995)